MTSADAAPRSEPEVPVTYCTAINCMDGRAQLPVIGYLRDRFGVEYVDVVTEAGPVALLADAADPAVVQGIHHRVTISLERHQSRGLAVVAHHDCAGNPVPPERQREQLKAARQRLRERYPTLAVVALWVNERWQVEELG